jgi:hypothetical protein
MMALPWESISGRGFEDRSVYLEKFSYLKSVLEEQEVSGFLSFYTNEVLWDGTVRTIAGALDLQFDTVLYFVTFFCLFSFTIFVFRNAGLSAILLLLNPLVVDFAFSQLRLAFAISLLIHASSSRKRLISLFLITSACFVHSATVLFVLMHWLAAWAHRKLQERSLSMASVNMILMGFGFLIALVIGPFREVLLHSIGDRRAEYTAAASTIGYASFWILFLCLVPLQGKKLYRDSFSMVAIICVAVFVGTTVLGVFGLRFLSALYPLIVVALLRFDRPAREALVLGFVAYTTVQWIYWVQ